MKTLVLALGLIMGTLAGPASSTEAVKSPKVLSKGEKATSPNLGLVLIFTASRIWHVISLSRNNVL